MPLEPPTVRNIPDVIPAGGIRVKDIILMPPGDEAPAITHDQAVVLGRALDSAQPFPVTAVLARVTIPGTIPFPGQEDGTWNPITGTINRSNPIQNLLAWVVTFTSPTPVDVSMGGPYRPNSSQPPRPILATHHTILFDAQTGEFRGGFFTP